MKMRPSFVIEWISGNEPSALVSGAIKSGLIPVFSDREWKTSLFVALAELKSPPPHEATNRVGHFPSDG